MGNVVEKARGCTKETFQDGGNSRKGKDIFSVIYVELDLRERRKLLDSEW